MSIKSTPISPLKASSDVTDHLQPTTTRTPTNHEDLTLLPLTHPLIAKHESRIIFKFDAIILPLISLTYFLSNLDKSNIGNAYTSGLAQSLDLKGNQYGNVISLLFVTYTVFETPVALSLKGLGARFGLGLLVLAFGAVSIGTAFVRNYNELLTCRILLGLFESGIIPIINVYLAMLYTRKELGKRTAVVYSASALAGAFGGLLAYGLIKIDVGNDSSWSDSNGGSWRWLFAIEGAMTVCVVPLLIWLLPGRNLTSVWWLNADEKVVLQMRLQRRPDFYQDELFSWSEVGRSFTDIANILVMAYEFCVDLTLVGISTFLPAIIRGMGTFDKYEVQLLTIPYYALAFVSFGLCCYFSDKYQHRGSFLIFGTICEIIGYIILITKHSFVARYIGCLMLAIGMYPCSSLSITWTQNNNAGHYKRATIGGMITTIGSLSGILAGQIYTAKSAPRYEKGFIVALGMTCIALPFCLGMMGIFHIRNKKNAKKLLEIKHEEAVGATASSSEDDEEYCPVDDRDPRFKFLL